MRMEGVTALYQAKLMKPAKATQTAARIIPHSNQHFAANLGTTAALDGRNSAPYATSFTSSKWKR